MDADKTNKTMEYETRIMKLSVLPIGAAIFSDGATCIEIEDEAGGEFVIVSQHGKDSTNAQIAIDPAEWPILSEAIARMIAECRF